VNWAHPPSAPDLVPNVVHVWAVNLDRQTLLSYALSDLLSEDENERANRFRFAKDRRAFVSARGSLRVILAQYLKCVPGELPFSYGEYGKPYLSSQWVNSGLCFNLSHSSGMALVAVCDGHNIGVDVEHVDRRMGNRMQIAKRFFAPKEYEALEALSEEDQHRAFFYCWTRKEAFIKAVGEGLSYPLTNFEVNLDRDARLLHLAEGCVAEWTLRHLDPGSGYVGAVAIEGMGVEVECWQIP
jgi:4'-phosphopantetheinyl transferase